MKQLPWTPWHKVVTLREDVRTGELSLAEFAADLHDVAMRKGVRPIYENPSRFFELTWPALPLRDLVRDVALRLSGKNTKAIRNLELTYGGGKTHTLITLHHLMNDPQSLPSLPVVKQFRSHVGAPLPTARIAALCFDKLDPEKGMEVRDPKGRNRWLKQPWSVLAFQVAGEAGLRALHPEGANEERGTAPAEPLLADLLSMPQADGLATLILVDEVLMYARSRADMRGGGRLTDFFQYLCQAVVRVDRCALVASLLASDPEKSDTLGKELRNEIFDIFNRQREEGVQPVGKEDVAEVLRRRFFEPESIRDPDVFRDQANKAVSHIARLDETVRKKRKAEEKRYCDSYPFHPGLTDLFYTKWTQLDGFQRTRGILRTFAVALRDAERWDESPLVGPNVFLSAPGKSSLGEAARELAGTATREITEGAGNDWSTVLEGELDKARSIQDEQSSLKFRELEQAVCAVFLGSQPIGQKAHTPELMALVGATRPDRIEVEKGLQGWVDVSWFLDEAEFDSTGASGTLPTAWRLGNQPNLRQMHHDACANRVSRERVEQHLKAEVKKTKSLTSGAVGAGARVHLLPDGPRDITDDGEFHFAVLGPNAVSESGKPSAAARRFLDETTGPDRPRTLRNAVVLVVPSRDGLDTARTRIREALAWEEVRSQLGHSKDDAARHEMLETWTKEAKRRIPGAMRQAWSIVVTVNERNDVHAFKVTVGDGPLFATIKADKRARIQDSAISAEAILPGGPYDLWREDEPSRRVRDMASAFASNPKLPKMLRPQQILDTIDLGVRDGVFVASLARPDRSVRTWWRTPIEESARSQPELELFLPDRAALSELDPSLLKPGALPELWTDDSITVAQVVDYFARGRTVNVPRENYEEPVGIPACPREAVEAAISEAVQRSVMWLVNGGTSLQGESPPAGVLSETALLRAPREPLNMDELTPDVLPDAWKDGRTSPAALDNALWGKSQFRIPRLVLARAIGGAIKSRWLELAPESGPWPCDEAQWAQVSLKTPGKPAPRPVRDDRHTCSAELEPEEMQDLVEILPAVVADAAGIPLKLQLSITFGDGDPSHAEKVASINKLLEGVHSDLILKPTGSTTE